MKTIKTSLLLILGIASAQFLSSCEACQKARETASNVQSLTKAAEEIAKNSESSNKKLEERRAKGDTLAMPYKDLQAFLPSIGGYDKDGDASGESMNNMGFSYSTASQRYKKGESNIKVSVTDYNAAYNMFVGVTAMMNAGFSVENDQEIARGVDLGVAGAKGFETIKKKEKNASLLVAVSDRFFISLEGQNMDNTDALKEIAKNMDLKAMAAK
jgi:hypothetical protein